MKNNVVLDFVHAINSADTGRMIELMTNDHIFVDSQDNNYVGKDIMKQAWIGYFALFPDYKIEVSEIFEKGSSICLLGHASATYKNLTNDNNTNYWRIPAAWKAIVEDNKVKHWQVYADNSIVMDIMNKNK